MTIEDLKQQKLIILECISESKAYGLDTPESDTDIKGVFILPKKDFYGLNYIPQVSNATNDIVYYELGRYLELLSVNNPNILELLNTPPSAVLYKHPLLDRIDSRRILSKLCKNTFGKFAISQIKKAKGLKKKIVNPVEKECKSVLSFCYVNHEQGAIPLPDYLALKNWKQEDCGLINIPHMKNMYGLFYGAQLGYKGIMQHEQSNDVSLSSIPKEEKQQALLYFNKDGYSSYCKEYKEYWNWVKHRNEARYQNTQNHGKNYDAKNMMHTFRLLEMALEIAREKQINVQRPNREFLLEIKSGKFAYDTLLAQANKLQAQLEEAFQQTDLPEHPDLHYINQLAYELREGLYREGFY
ncbi:DNA polymerase beta superfamily protein [Zunongwangia pacifica]|uniref:Nucleotidyltransferase domain-containing protein n=1 Tax=Zunongwangia pacifica TaxID=2911062 RepID=A0A9X1ZS97_9FLAO|nr:nucleotidyltransferase domain-containing protein [Zunongwangia pacifica]MCL6220102.1 nucleotidyltransferase domain-containing protein [Zunongwangia pacifica]